jgi:hypothetical protein
MFGGILFSCFEILSIKANTGIFTVLIFQLFGIGSFVLFFMYFLKYTFLDDLIICKYPFFPEKKYKVKDIIGYRFSKTQYEFCLKLYFDKKELDIEISSKKSQNIINDFIQKNYEIIKGHNIGIIKTNGYYVKLKRNTSIIFMENNFELINYKKRNVKYLYSEIISVIFESFGYDVEVKITLDDGTIIKIVNYQCQGGVGLFEYLNSIKQS